MRGTENKFSEDTVGQSRKERIHTSYLSSVPDSSESFKVEDRPNHNKYLFNKDRQPEIFEPNMYSKGTDSFYRQVSLLSISFLVVGALIVSWPRFSTAKTHNPEPVPLLLAPAPDIQIQKIEQIDQQIANLGKAVSMLFARQESLTVSNPDRKADSESQLVEVITLKANLRVAPSKEASAVMAISKGTTLLVDRTEQNWFRVYSPNGELLWISADVVTAKQSFTEN